MEPNQKTALKIIIVKTREIASRLGLKTDGKSGKLLLSVFHLITACHLILYPALVSQLVTV